VLDVDHDVAGNRDDRERDRRMNRDFARAKRRALHHGENLNIEEEHQEVAEADAYRSDHFPGGLTDPTHGGDGDGDERSGLRVGEPEVDDEARGRELRRFNRRGGRGVVREGALAAGAFGKLGTGIRMAMSLSVGRGIGT